MTWSQLIVAAAVAFVPMLFGAWFRRRTAEMQQRWKPRVLLACAILAYVTFVFVVYSVVTEAS